MNKSFFSVCLYIHLLTLLLPFLTSPKTIDNKFKYEEGSSDEIVFSKLINPFEPNLFALDVSEERLLINNLSLLALISSSSFISCSLIKLLKPEKSLSFSTPSLISVFLSFVS
ncbi:Uncharacterised protein [Metamycoplasma alkalescens]|uniref:Uncharacterized protein n=1 Tax=Metamycoplasma alkalescens TaxID=45363 RepID=A0A3B0NZQ6_9BACT|nr:Uncharacterised protein [Metamycoplasma alkalescens]